MQQSICKNSADSAKDVPIVLYSGYKYVHPANLLIWITKPFQGLSYVVSGDHEGSCQHSDVHAPEQEMENSTLGRIVPDNPQQIHRKVALEDTRGWTP